MMTKIGLLSMLKSCADDYVLQANESITRNCHMNEFTSPSVIEQDAVDALIVDFINYVASEQGVDYGLRTCDLESNIGKDLE